MVFINNDCKKFISLMEKTSTKELFQHNIKIKGKTKPLTIILTIIAFILFSYLKNISAAELAANESGFITGLIPVMPVT